MAILAAAMIALLGFTAMVVDIGQLVTAKYKLVNAVDASAMAGAGVLGKLPLADPNRETSAIQAAEECAAKNDAANVNISIDDNKVSVSATATVKYFFAPVVGIDSGQVDARAAARVGSLRSYNGVLPFVIKEQTFIPGQAYTLKSGKPTSPGNYGGMDIDDSSGAKDYGEYILNGYPLEVFKGGTQYTEPGNMTGPSSAIETRIGQCNDGCTWDNFLPGCPRLVVIPTHNENKTFNGKESFTVTGLATFFINDYKNGVIDGIYVNAPGSGQIDFDQPINGLYGIKLVE